MIINDNKKIIERYFDEVWNKGDVDVLDELLDSTYINHNPGLPDMPVGPEGLKPIVNAMREGLPDLFFKIDDMVVTSEKVAIRCTMHGTHLGCLFGVEPTGKKVTVKQMQVEHIKNGKIVEHWRLSDDLFNQL